VSKQTIKLASLLSDTALSPRAPAGPKVLLGVLEDEGERPVWRDRSRKVFAALVLVMIVTVGLAAIPELAGAPAVQTRVPLKTTAGSLFVVPVEINGTTTLDFAIDSGASAVVLSAGVFSALKRAGVIKEKDITGQEPYVLADGSKGQGTTFTIRSLKVGTITVENVEGTVTSSQGSLLLGQSFLGRFKSWSLDNMNQVLFLELSSSDWTLALKKLRDIGCDRMTRISKWLGVAAPEPICAR
jgi:clan AA aspartic protease (TIGR02281 family)